MINNLPMIKGIGYRIPEKVITNEDLTHIFETSDEWIYSRTGIKERHIFASDEEAKSMLKSAVLQALDNAGVEAENLDLIITATSMPMQLMPTLACEVQNLLNIQKNIPSFDMSAACSGMVFALDVANAYIRAGIHKNILIVTFDNCSRFLDWTDRRTSVLFGDGVGAMVVCAGEEDDILTIDIKSDGKIGDFITLPLNNGNCPFVEKSDEKQFLSMKGQDVYKFVANIVPNYITDEILAKNNINPEDIDYLILHQANQRIIKAVQTRLEYNDEKVISNIEKVGNTSASSIITAMGEAIKSGQIKTPSKAIICGFGAGMCWGGGVINLRNGILK